MRKKVRGIVIGILLLIIGILLFLEFLGVLPFSIFFKGWWTLFLIIPCTVGFFFYRSKVLNLFGIGFGILLLLAVRGTIPYLSAFQFLFAFLVIYLGIFLTIRSTIPKETVHGSKKKYAGVLGSCREEVIGELAHTIVIKAFLGNVQLDFSKATMKKPSIIYVTSILGSVELSFPEKWEVDVQSMNFLGICDKKRHLENGSTKVSVVVTNIMGETDIR